MAILTIFILGFVSLLAASAVSEIARGVKNYPPGPRPLLLVGNLRTIRGLQNDPVEPFLALKRRWGGLCMLWFGSQPVVVVNDPKIAKELLNEVGCF